MSEVTPKQWEEVVALDAATRTTSRLKVPGGWIVEVTRTTPTNLMSLVYIPDPQGTWNPSSDNA